MIQACTGRLVQSFVKGELWGDGQLQPKPACVKIASIHTHIYAHTHTYRGFLPVIILLWYVGLIQFHVCGVCMLIEHSAPLAVFPLRQTHTITTSLLSVRCSSTSASPLPPPSRRILTLQTENRAKPRGLEPRDAALSHLTYFPAGPSPQFDTCVSAPFCLMPCQSYCRGGGGGGGVHSMTPQLEMESKFWVKV